MSSSSWRIQGQPKEAIGPRVFRLWEAFRHNFFCLFQFDSLYSQFQNMIFLGCWQTRIFSNQVAHCQVKVCTWTPTPCNYRPKRVKPCTKGLCICAYLFVRACFWYKSLLILVEQRPMHGMPNQRLVVTLWVPY